MLRRFDIRLTALFLVLFLVVQATIVVAVHRVTQDNVKGTVEQELAFSGRTFQRLLSERRTAFRDAGTLLSRDFGFASAVSTRDVPTIQSALLNLTRRVDACHAVMLDLDGQRVTEISRCGDSQQALDYPTDLAKSLSDAGEGSITLSGPAGLYDFIFVPVKAPLAIGWIGLGLAVDTAFAEELRSLLPEGMAVSILYRSTSSEWEVAGSSIDLTNFDIPDQQEQSDEDKFLTWEGTSSSFLSLTAPFGASLAGGTRARAAVHSDLTVAYASYDPLYQAIFWLSLAGLGIFTLGSNLMATNVTRPLRSLVQVTEAVSSGDLREVTSIRRRDEFGKLASSFNAMITAIRERESKISHQAMHDMETGLPNRRHIAQTLDRLLTPQPDGSAPSLSVMVARVAGADEVRHTLGHRLAEDMMRTFWPRLTRAELGQEMLARINDVGFALVLPSGDPVEVAQMAQDLLQSLAAKVRVDDVELDPQVTLGIATAPEHDVTAEGLLEKAIAAAVQTRAAGQQIAIYNADADTEMRTNVALMAGLAKSLERGDLFLTYQPKIDTHTGLPVAAEALVRWIHPEFGFIPPDRFVALAEQTGQIGLLTDWVMEEAIRQAGIWNRQGIAVKVGINMSAHDLSSPYLLNRIRTLVDRHNVRPEWIALEVTESGIIEDPGHALMMLNQLREAGFQLAIDDFGTGHSSFSYLKDLPIHELKIDRVFVMRLASDRKDQMLVQTMINLAHRLGLWVTAEGVEDEATIEILSQMDCDVLQGYYYSRPVKPNEFETFWNERTRKPAPEAAE